MNNAIDVLEQNIHKIPYDMRSWALRMRDALRNARETAWKIVDLVMEAERYGEEVYQVFEWLGISHQEFMRWKRIGQSFPPALRNPNISIYHHEELIRKTLPEEVRKEILDIAQQKHLKRDEVRQIVREYRLNVERKYSEPQPKEFPKQDVVTKVITSDGQIEVRDSRTVNNYQYAYESFKAQMINFFTRHPQYLEDAINLLQKIKFELKK